MVKVSNNVMFAGDWHGDIDWAERAIVFAANNNIDTIFHVGDFGIWPGDWGSRFLKRVNQVAEYEGVTLAVTPGNHEDWARLDEKKAKDKGDGWGSVKHLQDNILVFPRAHRVELEYSGGTRSLVSLGGAPSIDFPSRHEGSTWWKSEAITQEDVDNTVAGGSADIMVAHDSPDAPWAAPKVHDIIYDPVSWQYWSEAGLRYAKEGRDLMHAAYEGVMPKMFFHGHYHVFSMVAHEHGEVWALDMQKMQGNLAILDLTTLQVLRG